ncbi:MAG TPA: TrkA C-terminal domain-containing protein, partial [Candidatus Baltobacteraceae bacterium]
VSSLAVTVPESQVGQAVADIEQPARIRIAAIRRNKRVFVAQPTDRLQIGDEVNAVVAPEALSEFAARFASSTFPITLSA